MKQKLLLLMAAVICSSAVLAQSLVSEKLIPLTKDMKKHEMLFALNNENTDGITVFFEPQKMEKVKGEKRKYQRLEVSLDKDLNIIESAYKELGTRGSVRPQIYLKDCRLSYFTWVDKETEDKIDKIMLSVIKFDLNNTPLEAKDFELCDYKGFDNYRVMTYDNKLYVLAQYEKKKTKDKNEKNKDFLVYIRIDPATMETEIDTELNLFGKDDIGLEALLLKKDKMFLVAKQIQEWKIGIKITKGYVVFRLTLDGTEEARGDIIPPKNMGIGSCYITENNGILYIAGEYGDPKKVGHPPSPSYGGGSKRVQVLNPFIGMFIKRFNFDLVEQGTATFSYKETLLKKLKKGNPGFTKKKGNYDLHDFYFCSDGSFYIVSEMFCKYYRTVSQKVGDYVYYYYYTDFVYLDALVFKFNQNGELDWLIQLDRDTYMRTYDGFYKTTKPLEPGKIWTQLNPDDRLIALYNTPGRKYNGKRFGLSEAVIAKDGTMLGPFDYTSNATFGMIDDGLIIVDNNTVMAVGTDKKNDNLWIKKIKLVD